MVKSHRGDAMAARNNKKDQKPSFIKRIRQGEVLSSDFFARNWLTVFAGVVVVMLYITNKYTCQTKMEEIRRLETELEIVKTERLRVRSAYMSNTRESSMQHLIDSLGLNLRVQDRPPFKLEKK
ncbi:hypothetical protein EEL49_11565 [Muribaculaceae bacterium Isolate-104 (HZI)]|jgi:hypothetical protein|nr:hypothetical protein EEL49_11565 [Muribaculaceae bacterium Isolate-104 (HZI)]